MKVTIGPYCEATSLIKRWRQANAKLFTVSFSFIFLTLVFVPLLYAAEGFEYAPDPHTLLLWHFNKEDKIVDESGVAGEPEIEGKLSWENNEDWNKGNGGKSVHFDGDSCLVFEETAPLLPEDAITLEAWIYPEDTAGWRLIIANWDGAPGAYHLAVQDGQPRFHVNTENGTADASGGQVELETWQHICGTYDSEEGEIKLFKDGQEIASQKHGGKMFVDNGFAVTIGTKNTRDFKFVGLMDEVRISDIVRKPENLSPNLGSPQAVTPLEKNLAIMWGQLKQFN